MPPAERLHGAALMLWSWMPHRRRATVLEQARDTANEIAGRLPGAANEISRWEASLYNVPVTLYNEIAGRLPGANPKPYHTSNDVAGTDCSPYTVRVGMASAVPASLSARIAS